MNARLVSAGTLAALSFATVTPHSTLGAQGAQEQVQLAFGYQCDDKFILRNDGTQPVTVEYGVAGVEQRSPLDLRGKESVELTSTAANPVELWMNGKIIASEEKGNRSCAGSQGGGVAYEQASPVVVVRPIIEAEYVGYAEPAYYGPRVVVVPAYPQYYGYRPAPVIVAPLFRSYGVGTYGRDVRVTQGGTVGRFNSFGGSRPVPNHVEPRRPPQNFTGGRERQVQFGGGARPAPQYATGGHSRPVQQQSSGGHTRQSQGDKGHSHHR
jgi:hypothetical protein